MTGFRPQSILVYVGSEHDDALGENIIKLPFLRAIRATFPDASVAWAPGLGPPQFAGTLKPLVEGLVDELVPDLDFPNRVAAVLDPRRPLGGRSFDLIIDTQRHPLRSLQCRRIRHRRFISGTWGWMLSDGRPPAEQRRTPLLVDRLVELVAAAAGRVVEAPYDLPLASCWRDAAARLLPEGPVYVGLAPGAGNKARGKCWPLANYLAVGRDQAAKGRVPVFILGPLEREWEALIRSELPEALVPPVDGSATGGLGGPALTVALGGRLAVAVANCSGTGHMLAAGGAAMVSLFAPTDPRKYAPHARRRICLRTQDFGGAVIDDIPVEAVVSAVEDYLAAGQSATAAAVATG